MPVNDNTNNDNSNKTNNSYYNKNNNYYNYNNKTVYKLQYPRYVQICMMHGGNSNSLGCVNK